MKVVLISLARRGGMVHFHAELANAMHPIEPETKIIVSRSVVASYYSSDIPGLLVDNGDGPISSLLRAINPVSWRDLYQLLQMTQADIFHIVASHEWNPLLVHMIRKLGKPLVFTIHDPEHHLGTPWRTRISDNYLVRKSDAVVVLSKLGGGQLQKQGIPAHKIYQIPHGVYSFFTRWDVEHVQQEKVMLFFGRIEPYKGVDLLLDAFSKIVRDLPDWKLVIAGNGDFSAYASAFQHPQIEVINKFIPDDEVSALMKRSSMVVLPYLEATQSGVIPTAYSFARPVIATRVGSLEEMVAHGQTGLIVPANNPDELAQAIKTLALDDGLRNMMGKQAYEMAMNEWNWTGIARKHLDVYGKVVDKYDGSAR
jgi:glycosyltransferase involved in cell wall biosynthesis